MTEAIWRSVELYRGGVAALIDEAVNGLQAWLDEGAEGQRLGEQQVGERIVELTLEAKQLDELAQRLEWILPAAADPRLGQVSHARSRRRAVVPWAARRFAK
jgi:hypothetical protein